METIDELRVEMIALVGKNFKLFRNIKEFIPGETSIPVSGKVVDIEEVNQLIGAVMDMWWTDGSYTSRFEARFKRYLNMRHAAFCNSGSSANLLAVAAAKEYFGWKDGDKIVTSACGFPTTLNAIIQNNLIPVFVDVELPYYVPSISTIVRAIHKYDAVAVFMAHTLGNPFDVKAISEYVPVLEDNCDALGSKINDRYTGTLGVAATQSFYPAHHITTSEGGMVLTRYPKIDKIVRSLRDWGRDCAIAGQLIMTERGMVPVEEITVGDRVVDKNGELSSVTALTGQHSRPTVEVKVRLRPPVVVSSGHPFLVYSNGSEIWKRADDLTNEDCLIGAVPRLEDHYRTAIVKYKTAYKEATREIKINPNVAKIIGYWCAEGSLASGKKGGSGYRPGSKYLFHRVDFSFGSNAEDLRDDLRDLMEQEFGLSGFIRNTVSLKSIHFKSRLLYELLRTLIGTGAPNKRLPYWFLSAPDSVLRGFLHGYWAGDGHCGKKQLSIASTSPTLIEQTRLILLRFGILASQWKRDKEKHQSSVVNGMLIKAKHDLHSLSVYGQSAAKLANLLRVEWNGPMGKNNAQIKDGKVLYPIVSVKPNGNQAVYNIEVEGSHSYHLGGLISHNCWCPTGKDNTCGKRFDWDFPCLPRGFDHKYVYSRIGYNMKGTDLAAAIGVGQLKKLEWFVARRKENHDRIYGGLKAGGMEEFFVLPEPYPESDPSWFGFLLTVRDGMPFTRNALTRELNLHKVGTRNLFGGNLLKQPAYAGLNAPSIGNLKNSDKIARDTLWVGCYPGITDEMCDYMVEIIISYAKGAEGLMSSDVDSMWE